MEKPMKKSSEKACLSGNHSIYTEDDSNDDDTYNDDESNSFKQKAGSFILSQDHYNKIPQSEIHGTSSLKQGSKERYVKRRGQGGRRDFR